MIVIPDSAKVLLLKWMLGVLSPPATFRYRFFTNNLTPDESVALGDFTEASGGNISPHDVATADWGFSLASHVEQAAKAEQTLTVTGAVSLYGFYVTDTSNTVLYWCERFDGAPYSYPSAGGELKLTPQLSLADIT